ncbi:MAG TPA: peptide-methionine (R)-S-oxide reductase [Sorangium sp.]|nr:peptide-methionine (R)-S-oxide reductase [Sorangium sp.]
MSDVDNNPDAQNPLPQAATLTKTEQQWRQQLTAEQYRIARQRGTERAFSGAYWDTKDTGVYRCICCDAVLFRSDHKYDSGSGWPSFWQPAHSDKVALSEDTSHGMRRVEALCKQCGAHLGHVFPDGPQPSGERYCINSASLRLDTSGED